MASIAQRFPGRGEVGCGGSGRLGQPQHFPAEKGFDEEGDADPTPAAPSLRSHPRQLQTAGAPLL